ncbi:hypothetical protein BDB01DRAFT_714647 [Pilobolus umbonatus]|nr:hypothetical protein BDB01DRAFT_714647 [Pilobolus umbonatus]
MTGNWIEQQVQPQPQQPETKSVEKLTHAQWGVIKDDEFHALTLKHQRDLEILHEAGTFITDFYFWQANLGGYCMADMTHNMVVSPDTVYVLVRKIVEGAPHPGRRKKVKRE